MISKVSHHPIPGISLASSKSLRGCELRLVGCQFWILKQGPLKISNKKSPEKYSLYIYINQRVDSKFWKSLKLIDVGKKSYPGCFNQYDKLTVFQGAFSSVETFEDGQWGWDQCDFVFQQILPSLWEFQAFYVGFHLPPPKKRERGWLFAKFCFSTRWFKSWLFHPLVGDHLTFARITFSPSQKDHKDLPGRYILKISYLDLKAWNIFRWGKVFKTVFIGFLLLDTSGCLTICYVYLKNHSNLMELHPCDALYHPWVAIYLYPHKLRILKAHNMGLLCIFPPR